MLQAFIEEINNNKLKVDSIILSKGPERYEHFFTENKKRNARSLSKVVTGLAVGKGVEEGIIDPEDDVMQFFTDVEIINEKNSRYLKEIKIKHLLSMSMGHNRPLMMRREYEAMPTETDYIAHILNSDIVHPPGTYFVYTNAGTYLLSAIMQKITEQDLSQWIYEKVFKYIEIEKLYWERSSQGFCLGATGLHLDVEDVHKLGILILNKGEYKGRQVVDSAWIKEMSKAHISNQDYEKYKNPDNRCFEKMAYGYHLWVCDSGKENGSNRYIFGDGAEGQQLITSPEGKMVIAIMARMKKTALLEKIICDEILAITHNK